MRVVMGTACGSDTSPTTTDAVPALGAADKYSRDSRPDGNRNSLRWRCGSCACGDGELHSRGQVIAGRWCVRRGGGHCVRRRTWICLCIRLSPQAAGYIRRWWWCTRTEGLMLYIPDAVLTMLNAAATSEVQTVLSQAPGAQSGTLAPVPTVITNDPPTPFSSRQQEPAATPAPRHGAPLAEAAPPRWCSWWPSSVGAGHSWHATWAC